MKELLHKINLKLNMSQIILLGFAAVILTGAVLLSLPISSADGVWTSFLDTLFTSTSAVCVTGLIVHDTATYWSVFGRFVIMLLIQIGGLGVITISLTLAIIAGRRIGLRQRSIMQSAISVPTIGGIVRLTKFIVLGTLAIEGVGASLMAPVFIKDFGLVSGLGYAVFHSISAFCNAGFDLMGVRQPYSSLMTYSDNSVICITIMLLIMIGGIGFMTWNDLVHSQFRFKTLKLQTKVVLVTSGLLILVPAVYFYFFEFTNYSGKERVLVSLFQAVTPRTAGFNTADYGSMSDASLLLTTLLMMIGGSPGSTAGGFKTTTMAVLFCVMIATLGRHKNVVMFKRRIESDIIRDAVALVGIYFSLLLVGAFFMSAFEGIPVMKCLFECASALGTVGLTTGITPELSTCSHLMLISFMFFGRVGGLTLIYAAVHRENIHAGTVPTERVMIG